MSYDVQLYRREVKEKHLANSNDEAFFENEANLVPFTPEQLADIKEQLFSYGYTFRRKDNFGEHFDQEEYGATALLTNNCLYFSASGEGIFEISMAASEMTDTEEYVKYDPQNDGWEEIEEDF